METLFATARAGERPRLRLAGCGFGLETSASTSISSSVSEPISHGWLALISRMGRAFWCQTVEAQASREGRLLARSVGVPRIATIKRSSPPKKALPPEQAGRWPPSPSAPKSPPRSPSEHAPAHAIVAGAARQMTRKQVAAEVAGMVDVAASSLFSQLADGPRSSHTPGLDLGALGEARAFSGDGAASPPLRVPRLTPSPAHDPSNSSAPASLARGRARTPTSANAEGRGPLWPEPAPMAMPEWPAPDDAYLHVAAAPPPRSPFVLGKNGKRKPAMRLDVEQVLEADVYLPPPESSEKSERLRTNRKEDHQMAKEHGGRWDKDCASWYGV
jgi:hypothetical protein